MKIPKGLEVFGDNVSHCSFDVTNKKSLIDSNVKVANFDGIKEKFSGKFKLKVKPKSADAFFEDAGVYVLAEFKNGEVDEDDIIEKLYDSAIVLMEMYQKTPDWVRTNVDFILIYRDEDVNIRARHKLMGLGSSKSSDPVWFYITKKAPGFIYRKIEELDANTFSIRYGIDNDHI